MMPRARQFVLAATVLASAMAFIDGTVVMIALPIIQMDFHAGFPAMQWVVNAYTLTLGALILVAGALGDRIGRRRVFVIGIAIFALASLVCAFAPNVGILIGARAVQGIGGALLVPQSLAIIAATFPREVRGRAIGFWAAACRNHHFARPAGWRLPYRCRKLARRLPDQFTALRRRPLDDHRICRGKPGRFSGGPPRLGRVGGRRMLARRADPCPDDSIEPGTQSSARLYDAHRRARERVHLLAHREAREEPDPARISVSLAFVPGRQYPDALPLRRPRRSALPPAFRPDRATGNGGVVGRRCVAPVRPHHRPAFTRVGWPCRPVRIAASPCRRIAGGSRGGRWARPQRR